MKKSVRIICMSLVVCLFSQVIPFSGMKAKAKETEDQNITISVEQELNASSLAVDVAAKQEGSYTVDLVYRLKENSLADMQISFWVNGAQTGTTELPKYWTTEEDYRLDGAGNEFAPEPVLVKENVRHTMMQYTNFQYQEFCITLKQGVNQIKLTALEGTVYIKEMILTKRVENEPYSAQHVQETMFYDGAPICVEGEQALWKNSYWLGALSDGSSSKVSKSDPVKMKINYIGGANWKEPGATIYWTVDVPEEGWYAVEFGYRQTYVINGSTYKELRINGKLPYKEAQAIAFPYATDWETLRWSASDNAPYLIYLEEGNNLLSLTAVLGEYAEVCSELENVLEQLGDLYLDINMITGDSVDIYRDYQLFQQIPDFNERLKAISDLLKQIDEQLLQVSQDGAGSYAGSVRNMKQVVDLMLNNPYTSHRYVNTYYSNYTALNTCLSDMQENPLDLDYISLYAPEQEGNVSFWEKVSIFFRELAFDIKRFFASFSEDYNSISASEDKNEDQEHLTVWVNWGRDQAQILNNLIQSSFANEHNISVEVKVTNATIVQGQISGNGPDVILQQARTEPVNLAIRDVLYDLSQFEDYEEILSRFAEGAETPYTYQGGTYALPDTQTFMVLFCRTDIFDELGLEVPTTWEEFEAVSKVIMRNNLTVWMPYTQITDMNIVNTGIGSLNIFPTMMLQNGISLYSEDQKSTTLTSAESIELFRDWTSYYTKMSLPYQLDFYNRFRAGTCPMGIAPYTTYNTLKDAGSEIDGKWNVAFLPGVVDAEGVLNNASAGGGTGCAILKDTECPEAAWEFLKWWTSAETQLEYTNSLEAVLGIVGRVAVSNVEAFESMTWDSNMYDVLYQSLQKTKEINEVPGSYYVSRSLDFAFWNVVNGNENEKDMLITWGQEADKEIARKWKQYEK